MPLWLVKDPSPAPSSPRRAGDVDPLVAGRDPDAV
jgi:hypothetical protein